MFLYGLYGCLEQLWFHFCHKLKDLQVGLELGHCVFSLHHRPVIHINVLGGMVHGGLWLVKVHSIPLCTG